MKLGPDRYGYLVVTLRRDGAMKLCKTHRLVAQAFIPNPENKPQVNHIDGNKLNNNFDNLEWCTALENIKHAVDKGLRCTKGSNQANSKLTEEDVVVIKKLLNLNMFKYSTLAELFNVKESTISRIKRNISWKHVNG